MTQNQTKEVVTMGLLRAYRQLLSEGRLSKGECRAVEDKLREIHRATSGKLQWEVADLVQDYESFYTENWL